MAYRNDIRAYEKFTSNTQPLAKRPQAHREIQGETRACYRRSRGQNHKRTCSYDASTGLSPCPHVVPSGSKPRRGKHIAIVARE